MESTFECHSSRNLELFEGLLVALRLGHLQRVELHRLGERPALAHRVELNRLGEGLALAQRHHVADLQRLSPDSPYHFDFWVNIEK